MILSQYTYKNIFLLITMQLLFITATITNFTVASLVGLALSPYKNLATLPLAMIDVGTLLITFPAAYLMKYIGRKNGFMIGTSFGVLCSFVAIYAIINQAFFLFCLACVFMGVYQAFAQYYRYAATEVVSLRYYSRAISYVLLGGVVASIIGPMFASLSYKSFLSAHFVGCYFVILALSLFGVIIAYFLNIPLLKTDKITLKNERSLKKIIKQPQFITATVNAMVAFCIMILIMASTPLAMLKKGFTMENIALVMQFHLGGMYTPSFFTGHLVARFGTSKIIVLGCFLFVLSACLSIYMSTLLGFCAALLLLGIGWNFMYVASTTLLTTTYYPHEKEKTQAVNEILIFLTSAIVSFFAGWLLMTLGWLKLNIIIFPMVCCAIISLLYYRYYSKKLSHEFVVQ